MNSKIAFILAIILGAFAAIAVKKYIQKVESTVDTQTVKIGILVASTSLKANQLIKASDFSVVEIPYNLYDSQNMQSPEDGSKRIGTQIYYDVQKGIALMKSHFDQPNNGVDSNLENIQSSSSRLKPSERAVTLKVDGITGVAMLLKPGEYIDVYWTGQTSNEISAFLGIKPDASQNLEKVTTLLLSDVQIMALDNRYNLVPTAAKNRIMNVKENYGTITVRCRSYEEAKMLIHAQTSGKLTMTKKGEDDLVVEGDEALDLMQMLKLSRKVNALRKKNKETK
jgi:pilus assembly protein CpaB